MREGVGQVKMGEKRRIRAFITALTGSPDLERRKKLFFANCFLEKLYS